MGALALKAVSKKGKDKLAPTTDKLMDIGVTPLLGTEGQLLSAVCEGKRAILFVNVATK